MIDAENQNTNEHRLEPRQNFSDKPAPLVSKKLEQPARSDSYLNDRVDQDFDPHAEKMRTSTYSCPPSGGKPDRLKLEVGALITLKNKPYKILEIISTGTTEADIFKVEDTEKVIKALKLYHESSDQSREPNPEALKRIEKINDANILKLYDYGIGSNKFERKYCYELCEFAKGSDLLSVQNWGEKYTAKFVEKKIVPRLFAAIKKLHENRVIHCDIKPQNIFYIDRERQNIVIGDYGSSKTMDNTVQEEAIISKLIMATSFYAAPELQSSVISKKADYFSFGMTLLHLLYPEDVSKDGNYNILDNDKIANVRKRQVYGYKIVTYKQDFFRLNTLIEGLTLYDHQRRFGESQVQCWIEGNDVTVEYQSKIMPVTLKKGLEIYEPKDLIELLEKNPDWNTILFEDLITYDHLLRWIDTYDSIETRRAFNQMIEFYQPKGNAYLKEAAVRFFHQDRPIELNGRNFNFVTASDVQSEVNSFFASLDDVWKTLEYDRFVFLIFQLEFSLRQVHMNCEEPRKAKFWALIDKLFSVFNLVPDRKFNYQTKLQDSFRDSQGHEDLIRIPDLFHHFNPARTYRTLNNSSLMNLESVGFYYIQNPDAYQNKFQKVELEVFLNKIGRTGLSGLNWDNFIWKVFDKEVHVKIEFVGLKILEGRRYRVRYSISESLNKFFQSKNIDKQMQRDTAENAVIIRYGTLSSLADFVRTTISELKKKHQNQRSSYPIDQNSIAKFESNLRVAYHKEWKTTAKYILLPAAFAVGLGIYDFIQGWFNQVLNASTGFNIYNSIWNYVALGTMFSLAAYSQIHANSELKVKRQMVGVTGILLLVYFSYNIIDTIQVYKSIKDFQSSFYFEYFLPSQVERMETYNREDIHNLLLNSWSQNEQFIPRSSVKYHDEGLLINSNATIIAGTLYEPAWSYNYQIDYQEVESFPYEDQAICILSEMSSKVSYNSSFSATLNATQIDSTSSIGLKVGDLRVKIVSNKIHILQEDNSYLKDHYRDNNTVYYILLSSNKNHEFTETKFLDFLKPSLSDYSSNKVRPYGITDLPVFCNTLHVQEMFLEESQNVKLQVNIIGEQIQIKLNDSVVKNMEVELKNHNIYLLYGLKSELLIRNFTIDKIVDNRINGTSSPENQKPVITFDPGMPLYKKLADSEFQVPKSSEEFEVLYEVNGFYKAKSNLDFEIYFIPKDRVKNLILK